MIGYTPIAGMRYCYMIISIVSGSYNRISYLKQMVESARLSVGIGIDYEFCIVDGGSNDGTQEWCKAQKDIRLIEHGKLLGAVKAFNDGAYAATGIYVILANDDIIFLNQSIQSAIRFMQDNPNVGVGCFYQDRYNRDWHVDMMTAQVDGGSKSVWYGQVCIVPKWLGDKMGWWGNYLRTYGGDNELSCNVLEYGYKILPIPCACIHDLTPEDELRVINNPTKAKGANHPDSAKWMKKWDRHGKFGAIVRQIPMEPNPIQRYYRILYAPIYEPGWGYIQKAQKVGLRKALAKKGLVVEIDWTGEGVEAVLEAADRFDPDIIVTQIQDAGTWTVGDIKELKLICPNTITVLWNGDYHIENLQDKRYIYLIKEFSYCGFVTTQVNKQYSHEGVNYFYWQIGFEESLAEPDENTPKHDIVFLANGYSEDRIRLAMFLRSLPYNVGIYGSWPDNIKANGNTLYDFDAGHKIYKNAKLAIGDSQWPDATGFVSNRLFQAMCSGICYMQQNVDGLADLLKLQDRLHLITWRDLPHLRSIIDYCMSNPIVTRDIGNTGRLEMLAHHSFDSRVSELWHKFNI